MQLTATFRTAQVGEISIEADVDIDSAPLVVEAWRQLCSKLSTVGLAEHPPEAS